MILKSTIDEVFSRHGLEFGRLITGSKSSYRQRYPDDLVLFNANVFTEKQGKIWHGDLNLTKEGTKLMSVAEELGCTLYVVRELDGRFGKENDPFRVWSKKASWNSKTGIGTIPPPENFLRRILHMIRNYSKL